MCMHVYARVCVHTSPNMEGRESPVVRSTYSREDSPSVVSCLTHFRILSRVSTNIQRSSSVSFLTTCISFKSSPPPLLHLKKN